MHLGPFKKGALHIFSASSDAATFVSNVKRDILLFNRVMILF